MPDDDDEPGTAQMIARPASFLPNDLTWTHWNNSIDVAWAGEDLGSKKLAVCPSDAIKLIFPPYPGSTRLANKENKKYEDNKAYDALDNSDCSDDYRFAAVDMPIVVNGQGWQSEHIMEGQTMKEFFKAMAVDGGIRKDEVPAMWRKTQRVGTAKETSRSPCRYFGEWWVRRTDIKGPEKDLNAMTYLLREYPGDDRYLDEIVLLRTSLNGKKQRLFSSSTRNFRNKSKWLLASKNAKINELREWLLLIAVSTSALWTWSPPTNEMTST